MGNVISWINSNLADDDRQGEARDENQPDSLWGLINTMIPSLLLTAIYVVLFLATRRSQKRFYSPRSYLGSLPEHERSPQLPDGWLQWLKVFRSIPDSFVLHHQSLDAYLFLRYLRICTVICLGSLCVSWTILLPINATGGNGKSQLELLSYSNIDIEHESSRLWAHVLIAWIIYGFVMYTVTRECIFYINLRQVYLLGPGFANRISSRTIMFTCVPDEYLEEESIRGIFGKTVKNVWLSGATDEVDKAVIERDKVALKLEKAEVSLLKQFNKLRIRASRRAAKNSPQDEARQDTMPDMDSPEVAAKVRPTHRLGFLGLVGEKVDTIHWSRSELQRLIPAAEAAKSRWQEGHFRKTPCVFVEFSTHTDAQIAYQLITHHHGFRMTPKHIAIKPEQVIWKNLNIPWWRRIVCEYVAYGFIAVLIVFWAIPVGVVGIVAQINVIKSLPGLSWINELPKEILGVVSGLLPSAALAFVMSWVPGIMRFSARFAGATTFAEVELFTQNAYFIFQLIQVFLIQTITNTAATAIVQIAQEPTMIFGTLAGALPTSSNFYISYFIIQGFTIAIDVVTQAVNCVFFKVVYRFWARTPRAMYVKWTTLEHISWGSLLPVYTGIVTISVAYAVIAPFLLFWSTVGIWIFYQAYRYNIIFVSDTKINTHGLIYPRALKQLFAGIYVAEICLIGMFAVSKATGQVALMVIFLVLTVLYQITLGRALDPLLYNMPCTIQADEAAIQQQASATEDAGLMEDGLAQVGSSSECKPVHHSISKAYVRSLEDHRAPNFVQKFLMPWVYEDYWTLRRQLKLDGDSTQVEEYSDDVELKAYIPPCVARQTPTLWIPEDPAGISKREMSLTSHIIGVTDEGCRLDDTNKIVWDTLGARPPIWKEKIDI